MNWNKNANALKSEEEVVLLESKIRKLLLTGRSSDWEKDFLKSVLGQLVSGRSLTEKQRAVLNKIMSDKK